MIEVQAPEPPATDKHPYPRMFLSGSIEMGTADTWQERIVSAFAGYPGTILNPRRDDWDASWKQSIEDDRFREQVEWKLRGLEDATLIATYFDPNTKAPITLLEMGLFTHTEPQPRYSAGKTQRLLVCCPDGFWKKGNVEIVCKRYGIPLFHNEPSFIAGLAKALLEGRS